ncbi:MAG: maleylacetate reductase [Solirubrobacterales bacterium]|nr:maleylacetate reductase [Solirubrobacterales bacterium]
MSAPAAAVEDFFWRDGERIVVFRRGALARAPELLAEQGWERFDLLSTERALAEAPPGLRAVGATHLVPDGGVPEAAAAIIGEVRGEDIVALGGGRVIDTAKAIAAARGGRVAAIPTTLSGAEMTRIHRLPPGHEGRALVRPALVLADPEAMTSQPEERLRASAMNALAHGADSLCTPFANPVSTMAALRGAELLAQALDEERDQRGEGDRAALALASLLCAYALDSALFALHHVVCQTIVRICGTAHAETNAAMLPLTLTALAERAPERLGPLAVALGTDLDGLAARIVELAGGSRTLSELGAARTCLDDVLEAALARAELQLMSKPPDREQLRRLLEQAW